MPDRPGWITLPAIFFDPTISDADLQDQWTSGAEGAYRRIMEQLASAVEWIIPIGQPATTTVAATASQSLNVDDLLRLVGHMRAEQRWLYGRPVRAMKVGRVELRYVRASCQPAPGSLFGSLTLPGDHCWGIPCYEVGRHSYYEPIYEDEAPTLEVLNERLMQEPPAIWGEVVAG